MHMPRKRKIPPEFLNFKETVETHGFRVMITNSHHGKGLCALVLKGKHCMWHSDYWNGAIPLSKFWESTAWKKYEESKKQN